MSRLYQLNERFLTFSEGVLAKKVLSVPVIQVLLETIVKYRQNQVQKASESVEV